MCRLKDVDYCNLFVEQDFEGDTFLDVEFHVLDKVWGGGRISKVISKVVMW